MTDIKQAFTPYAISLNDALFFSIPLYQRLFEWGEEQITQLLDDLYSSYKRDNKSPYYIGMLTTKELGNNKELVDGQQRFTAMVLLGIHFGWKEFLLVDNEPRLHFTARIEDKEYLMARINGKTPTFVNDKMEKGLGYIASHLKNGLKLETDEEQEFGEFIFHNMTFFLSKLPKEYSSKELNTYFERMNTSGKSLENYDILKVEVIRRLPSDVNKEQYTLLWNAVSIMEKMILRKHNKEQLDRLRKRYLSAILDIVNNQKIDNAFEKPQTKFDTEYEDDASDDLDEKTAPKSIGDIEANPENPFKIVKRRSDEHSLLFFPEFLLQVLYLCLDKDIDEKKIEGKIVEGINTTDFFDVRKLNVTFAWAFDKRGLDAKEFMHKLGLYRLITDFFIIRMNDEDEDPYPFLLYNADEEGKMKVRMYLAMLYSASSAMTYYYWMPELLNYLVEFVKTNESLTIDADDYLKKLKAIDDKWHPWEEGQTQEFFTFGTIDRYWFWRIDYYLWEKRELFFKDQRQKKVVEKYVFRRNRSIEHIAPQHPKDEYGDKKRFNWNDENQPGIEEKRDCLGNLVMISSGQNSSLSNSCFEVKRAVMQRYASGVGNGSVESLKMFYVYSKYDNWSIENIDSHQQFSIDFLEMTYKNDGKEWSDFAAKQQ